MEVTPVLHTLQGVSSPVTYSEKYCVPEVSEAGDCGSQWSWHLQLLQVHLPRHPKTLVQVSWCAVSEEDQSRASGKQPSMVPRWHESSLWTLRSGLLVHFNPLPSSTLSLFSASSPTSCYQLLTKAEVRTWSPSLNNSCIYPSWKGSEEDPRNTGSSIQSLFFSFKKTQKKVFFFFLRR